jgi:hypothetical protein
MGNEQSSEVGVRTFSLKAEDFQVVRELSDKRFKKLKVITHKNSPHEQFMVEHLIDEEEGQLAAERIYELQQKPCSGLLLVQGKTPLSRPLISEAKTDGKNRLLHQEGGGFVLLFAQDPRGFRVLHKRPD